MPRRTVQFAEGEIYHVINRGAVKMNLFFDDGSYHRFIQLIHRYAPQTNITVIALCLMPNHFHLLLRIESEGDISKFMRLLSSAYSRILNEELRRTGTIYEGRFFASHVATNDYLTAALRYIHLNPVRAGLVVHPSQWEYSDYAEATQQRDYIMGDHDFVRSLFGNAFRYESYVTANMNKVMIDHSDLARDLAEAGLL